MTAEPQAASNVLAPLSGPHRRTAHQSVAAILRSAILSGQLPGGMRLVQSGLAAQLGTSNTPVREAMRELATEGLIELDSYRGAVVHSPSAAEILESYELCLLLEPLAMRKAVSHMTPEALDAIRASAAEMRRIDDIGTYVEMNLRFHAEFHRAAASPRLEAILRSLHHTATLYTAHSMRLGEHRGMRDSDNEHDEIVRAAEEGDADRAAGLVADHIRRTIDAVKSVMGTDGDVAPPR